MIESTEKVGPDYDYASMRYRWIVSVKLEARRSPRPLLCGTPNSYL